MNRRTFLLRNAGALACGAASVTAAATLGSCATRPRPATGPRLSTSSILFKEWPIERACEHIAGLGFEAIDIWCAYEGCPHLDDVAARLGGQGLREVLERCRLQLFAFSTYVGGYAKYARLLGEAGGGVAIQGSAGPCPPAELTARMKSFFEGLKPLAALAEEHRSWLAIENHGHALLDGLDSFQAFVDLNPFPRVGIALAPYHLQAVNASVPEAIRIAGSQLKFFYAWQHAEGIGQLPGHGPADFAPWLAALHAVRYSGWVNVFMHGHPGVEATTAAVMTARDYLRKPSPNSPGRQPS